MTDTRTTEELLEEIKSRIGPFPSAALDTLADHLTAQAERQALLEAYEAEHEAHKAKNEGRGTWEQLQAAHDHAERVRQG